MPAIQASHRMQTWFLPGQSSAAQTSSPAAAANPFQSTDRLNLSTRQVLGLSTLRLIEPMPELSGLKTKQLTPSQQQILNSADFQNIFRNFDVLPAETQHGVLQKLEQLLKTHPDFMTRLQQVDNPQYGPGFQFFFVPPHGDPRWSDVPAGVRGTGPAVDFSGIVFSSPAQTVLKQDGFIRKGLQWLTMEAVEAINQVRKEPIALDSGGMFSDSSADTFAHEMGHVLHSYFLNSAEQLEIWAIYSQAQEANQGFITDYSRTNHMEFFAEGVEAYLQQDAQGNFSGRDALKKTNPQLYQLVERLLEPGADRSKPQDPALSAWIIARTKGLSASQALQQLGLSGQKQGCACRQQYAH